MKSAIIGEYLSLSNLFRYVVEGVEKSQVKSYFRVEPH